MAVICIAEDRKREEVAVKLLLMSIAKHCPDMKVVAFFPPADDPFKEWLTKFPNVELRTQSVGQFSGWNVKPQALLLLLEEGEDEVWWVDSDIILTSDFRLNVKIPSPRHFVVCEEALYGNHEDDGRRAQAWGFKVGRLLPFALNSAVIRVTPEHVPLLETWKALLETEDYINAQKHPDRPIHLYSDQEPLTALLSGAEFASLPIKILKRGKHIIQYFGPAGYMPGERVMNLLTGLPSFVHFQGNYKPWRMPEAPARESMDALFRALYAELSPYIYIARQYRESVVGDLAWNWIDYSSQSGQFFKLIGFSNPALTGLPLAIAYSVSRSIKKLLGRL